ncbi:ABC-F family ATPase [Granulosicoccus antarcticus]|uniref:Probable ATP-binding protein YbiT n=1 Tax=Granulosicoccus antarcticus IMCC3135 TaxID=1192854 RepID=A0A2Z2P9I8_9GAMM|nr:ABC-F family ATPase [Granulosicoccus antarcticus]ASJ76554.1 putative ABC transporter ATP-binding protein YbiT [Granulosicoccus antarcticus IMCC3135]
MISTANLTIQFGAKPLFDNVSIKFGEGNRYGLIGANGSGKSTLMKILGGDLEPTSGNVTLLPGVRMATLQQNQFGFEQFTVIDTVIMGHQELWTIKEERDKIYAMPDMSEDDGMRVAELEVQFAELDGYTAESRAGELLLGAAIPLEQHTALMSKVAPGDKLRVLLAQALFADPDLLLLDEPTNNLDIDTIRWLEGVLDGRNSTMIIISHDRHFLNSICTHMADLDYGEIKIYPGNYDDFMFASTQARERQYANNAKKKAQIADLQAFVQRFKANKSKARQATSRQKQIDKLAIEKMKPSSRVNPYIRFELEKKLFRNAAELESITAGYQDNKVLDNLSLMIEAGEKVAIIGPNGIGKTTFVKMLAGELAPMKGNLKWAENATLGYFAQDHEEDFESTTTVLEWMSQWAHGETLDEQEIRGILGRLLFGKDDINKPVNVLSGGEKGRLLFGKLMMLSPNVMIMDEPTNHLDMESIESLNLAMDLYPGTVIFVSHDREFVSSLATRIIELKGKSFTDYQGNYEDYLESQGIS